MKTYGTARGCGRVLSRPALLAFVISVSGLIPVSGFRLAAFGGLAGGGRDGPGTLGAAEDAGLPVAVGGVIVDEFRLNCG